MAPWMAGELDDGEGRAIGVSDSHRVSKLQELADRSWADWKWCPQLRERGRFGSTGLVWSIKVCVSVYTGVTHYRVLESKQVRRRASTWRGRDIRVLESKRVEGVICLD